MKTLYMVIGDAGDGSNFIGWVNDTSVLDELQKLADKGDGCWASGDGLQVKTLQFPDDFDVEAWMKTNRLYLLTEV